MKIFDISPVFRPGMACWPGDSPYRVEQVMRIADGSTVNVAQLTISSQVGSHTDAPLHYRIDGRAAAELPLDPYIGPCVVVDARASTGATIGAEVLAQVPARVERVLLRQYDGYPDAWDPDFKGIDPALVEALAARGVKLIGIDAASVDAAESKTLDAHRAMDRHDIRIVEGLVLDAIAAGPYELIALPLKLESSDGAPLRAILRTARG
jgi:arylformamidase